MQACTGSERWAHQCGEPVEVVLMDPGEDPGDLEEVEDYGEDSQETLENLSKKPKVVKQVVSGKCDPGCIRLRT